MKSKIIDGYKLIYNKKIIKDSSKEIIKVLKNGRLANGMFVKRFEQKFKQLNKSKYAIACSSGGSALEVIFKSLELKDKDILVPSNTFIATYNAVKFSGANPILIDCEKNSLLISLKKIKEQITKKTKCICIVHIGSYLPNDINEIVKFCKKKKIILIEDCAHSVLTKINNKYSGNFGIAGAFSFYATKSVSSGEGGMITTNNYKLYKKMKLLTSYGMNNTYGSYDYKFFSSNYRMNEMEAIIGYNHLVNYKIYLNHKIRIKRIYDQKLSKKIQIFKTKSIGNLYKYICLLKNSTEKKKLIKYLNSHNIFLSGDVYAKPLHENHIIKKNYKFKLPNSSDICSRHICLPIYYGLSENKVNKICKHILKFLSN